MAQFVCLAGLPRSGSTVLSAILAQNPTIYAEGNSALCQIMLDMYKSCYQNASEQLMANSRLLKTSTDLIQAVPQIYYKNRLNQEHKVVLDKCRAWVSPSNIELLKQYIEPNVKIIVLERSLTDILKSFMKLYQKNNWSEEKINETLKALLEPNADPIMTSYEAIQQAKQNIEKYRENLLFIQYEDLVNKPEETIQSIYTFCGWPAYAHQFTDIIKNPENKENDEFYQLKDFHHIRPTLYKEPNLAVLPPNIGGNPLLPPL
jgi:sulfotransferase